MPIASVLAAGLAGPAAVPVSAWNVLSKAAEQWPFFTLVVGAVIALWIFVVLPYRKQRATERREDAERQRLSDAARAVDEKSELEIRLKISEQQTTQIIELAKLGESLRRSIERHEAAVDKWAAQPEPR